MLKALSNTATTRVIQTLLMAILITSSSTALSAGDAAAGKQKAASCAGCHGQNGAGVTPDQPNLAGQHSSYLAKQLYDFRSGARANAIMAGMSAGLSDQDIEDISAHYAKLPAIAGVADEAGLQRGEDIYRGGIADAGIPACSGCHGANGNGNPAAGFPMLSGQKATYTVMQLKSFRSKARANDPNAMMRTLALRLTDEEMEALANYISGLH